MYILDVKLHKELWQYFIKPVQLSEYFFLVVSSFS